jgi:hypothetical protein
MSRRSRQYRKRFKCGHRGFGEYCHCCAAAKARRELISMERRQVRQVWQQQFEVDPIDLTKLPKAIVRKARQVLEVLKTGENLFRLGGKLFQFDRSLIRFPVTYRYRLLCRWGDAGITPLKVVSHEDYNAIARGKRN